MENDPNQRKKTNDRKGGGEPCAAGLLFRIAADRMKHCHGAKNRKDEEDDLINVQDHHPEPVAINPGMDDQSLNNQQKERKEETDSRKELDVARCQPAAPAVILVIIGGIILVIDRCAAVGAVLASFGNVGSAVFAIHELFSFCIYHCSSLPA